MSRIKAIIYTSSDNKNNLVFENEDILAISTNTKCIENENLPEFDIFPNSGTLTVKDRNLKIYNKAINGIFDNYEYKVEYYLENQIIATHIINQRPRYDYDAKTCTFYLGNKLDKLSNQTFTPYAYPLKSQTLYEIFKEVLRKIFSITDADIDTVYTELMSNVWGTYTTQNFTSSLSFKEYFEKININYPYISQTNSREALKTILLIAQCGMYLDKNDKLKLIRLDGYSNATASEYYNNVYKIEPRHINKGFVPSVILDNRFNKFNLDYFSPKTIVNVDDPAYIFSESPTYKNGGWSNGIQEPSFTDKPHETFQSDTLDIDHVQPTQYEYFIAQAKLTKIINFYSKDIQNFSPIEKLQNNNLKEILELNVLGKNENSQEAPSIVVLCKKTVVTYKCGIYTNGLTTGNYDAEIEDSNPENIGEETTYEEINVFDNSEFSFDFVLNSLVSTVTEPYTLNVKVLNPYKNYGFNTKINNENFEIDATFLCGKTIELIWGQCLSQTVTEFPTFFPKNAGGDYTNSKCYKQIISYDPVKIDITYNGTVKEIVFDENFVSKKFDENQTFSYEENLQSNLELNQDTSSILGSGTKDNILSNLLKTFNGGLHTGTVTTVATDYDTYLPTDTSQIGRNKDQKIFEVGDKVMPFKDKPIINRVVNGVEEPVVFQIVDCETFNESGATFQNLVLREIKKPPTT